ncbi:MAG: hypothetical protein JXA13_15605 [Anaerolineales bacterium]|nr:hypothetical protein [Anaerolineales bacterium]
MNNWVKEFNGSVTVCDPEGTILEMNDQAAEAFASNGGRGLIGANLLDCHPEPARTKLVEMMRSQTTNTYTIEKKGQKEIIHQFPWYENGKYSGLVEITFHLPEEMPHFIRD